MAIPKKGSRKIVVENVAYRWLIRRKATHTQTEHEAGELNVAIELHESPKSTLVVFTDRPHPKHGKTNKVIPITPSNIENWIKAALDLNWKPNESGAQFRVRIENEIMKIQ